MGWAAGVCGNTGQNFQISNVLKMGLLCKGVFVDLGCLWLQRHQTGGSVCQHVEVGGGGRTHGRGPALGVHLVVDQTPLLQEGVDPVADERGH